MTHPAARILAREFDGAVSLRVWARALAVGMPMTGRRGRSDAFKRVPLVSTPTCRGFGPHRAVQDAIASVSDRIHDETDTLPGFSQGIWLNPVPACGITRARAS